MNCDMCGKENELFTAKVEGTEMNVCKNCARYGTIIRKRIIKKVEQRKHARHIREEKVEMIVPNYNELIKNAREKMGLKQEELAKKLNLKTSIINNMERKNFKPKTEVAKKIEKALRITLIKEYKEESPDIKIKKREGFTFGDLIKKK